MFFPVELFSENEINYWRILSIQLSFLCLELTVCEQYHEFRVFFPIDDSACFASILLHIKGSFGHTGKSSFDKNCLVHQLSTKSYPFRVTSLKKIIPRPQFSCYRCYNFPFVLWAVTCKQSILKRTLYIYIYMIKPLIIFFLRLVTVLYYQLSFLERAMIWDHSTFFSMHALC